MRILKIAVLLGLLSSFSFASDIKFYAGGGLQFVTGQMEASGSGSATVSIFNGSSTTNVIQVGAFIDKIKIQYSQGLGWGWNALSLFSASYDKKINSKFGTTIGAALARYSAGKDKGHISLGLATELYYKVDRKIDMFVDMDWLPLGLVTPKNTSVSISSFIIGARYRF